MTCPYKLQNIIYCTVVFLSSTVLNGCTTSGDIEKSHEKASICCNSIKEFSYEKLSIGGPIKFNIDEHSPAFNFNTGKSFFKAFQLPDINDDFFITIESRAFDTFVSNPFESFCYDTFNVFSPLILIMNKDYEVVRKIDKNEFRMVAREANSRLPGRRTYLVGEIYFTKENKDEKYLIILTTDKNLSEVTEIHYSDASLFTYGMHGLLVAKKPGKPCSANNSPHGKLSLSVHRYFTAPREDGYRPGKEVSINPGIVMMDGIIFKLPRYPDIRWERRIVNEGEMYVYSGTEDQTTRLFTYIQDSPIPMHSISDLENIASYRLKGQAKVQPLYKNFSYNTMSQSIKGASCIKIVFTADDHSGEASQHDVSELEGVNFICAHPYSAMKIVILGYTQNNSKGFKPVPYDAEINEFLNSIQFRNFHDINQ